MDKIVKIDACTKAHECFEDTLNEQEKATVKKLINRSLKPARENVSCRVADTLIDSFVFLYENRNRETREIRIITENFVQLYNQTIDTFQRFGVQEVFAELIPMFKGQKLSQLLKGLQMEQLIFARAGMDFKMVKMYGDFLDQHLAETIILAEEGNFILEMIKIPDYCGYLGSHDGNSWDGFIGFLSGAVTVANAVCTIPTAGLAATSVVVGVCGGIHAVSN